MTVVVGGVRKRLIKYSFEVMINDALDQLGWFADGRGHRDVRVIGSPVDEDTEVLPNVVSIAAEDVSSMEWELGSNLEEIRWDFYVDIYAENDAVGLHLAGDIVDVLKGKLPSIGRARPQLHVLDYQQATPVELFRCQLEEVDMAKVRNWTQPWQRYWYVVGCQVVDYYADENDVYEDND